MTQQIILTSVESVTNHWHLEYTETNDEGLKIHQSFTLCQTWKQALTKASYLLE